MADSLDDELLDEVCAEILAGRCLAFVGSGATQPAVPNWLELLGKLIGEVKDIAAREELETWLKVKDKGALDLEGIGQALRDIFGDGLEEHVAKVLGSARADPRLADRLRWIREIPFAALLTTNYDDAFDDEAGSPDGYAPTSCYRELLREARGWWEQVAWESPFQASRPRVIKLHGDANRDPQRNPIVLGRADYRARVYSDAHYASFLRTVLATRTVLFLGCSFTDAYPNELRSEVLSLVERAPGTSRGTSPWYAVLEDVGPRRADFFRRHEGIRLLTYPASRDHAGFDRWLAAIHARTAPRSRLQRLLHAGARASGPGTPVVVWVDSNRAGNAYGYLVFEEAGATVHQLDDPAQLDRARHGPATLLITRYGHGLPGGPTAARVLDSLKGWPDRPPVIVFASPGDQAPGNRAAMLRRGAYEYTTGWSELFSVIETLFGRAVGEPLAPPLRLPRADATRATTVLPAQVGQDVPGAEVG